VAQYDDDSTMQVRAARFAHDIGAVLEYANLSSPPRPLSAIATQIVALCTSNPTYVISFIRPPSMLEALCRQFGTTLDIACRGRAADRSANIGSRGSHGSMTRRPSRSNLTCSIA
jgi:hypothetical protein